MSKLVPEIVKKKIYHLVYFAISVFLIIYLASIQLEAWILLAVFFSLVLIYFTYRCRQRAESPKVKFLMSLLMAIIIIPLILFLIFIIALAHVLW